jgi:hypothetical protein
MQNLMTTAILYAEKGFPVFPVHSIIDGYCTCWKPDCGAPGKHPLTPRGFHDGVIDVLQIEQWWKEHPKSNIGLVTGKTSGVWVLDIDPRHGGDDSLIELEKKYGELPNTKVVLTGGGGRHIYFSYPSFKVDCRTKLLPGIDVRGNGGYVLAPPSCHVSGRPYVWEVSSWDHEFAPTPEWLLNYLHQPKFRESNIREELFSEIIHEGSRNDTIARLAGYLLGKGIRGGETLSLCLSVNQTKCCPPLPHEEVLTIVNSIAKKEFQKRQVGQHE